MPYIAPDGREVVIALVNATFVRTRTGRVVLADEQITVRPGDVVYDPDAQESSIRYPSDVGAEKRGTDVVVVGDAVAKAPVPAMDVIVVTSISIRAAAPARRIVEQRQRSHDAPLRCGLRRHSWTSRGRLS